MYKYIRSSEYHDNQLTIDDLKRLVNECQKDAGGKITKSARGLMFTTYENDWCCAATWEGLLDNINSDPSAIQEVMDDCGCVLDYFEESVGCRRWADIDIYKQAKQALLDKYVR